MSDAVWHYSQGDKEHGPITSAELKDLAAAGTLRAEDLVWREGMDDWSPASTVRGLTFKTADAAPAPAPAEPAPATAPIPTPAAAAPAPAPGAPDTFSPSAPAPADNAPAIDFDNKPESSRSKGPLGMASSLIPTNSPDKLRFMAFPVVIIGIFFCLLSKGCDTIGAHGMAWSQAAVGAARNKHEQKYEKKLAKIRARRQTLLDSDDDDVDDELKDLRDKEKDIEDERDEDEEELQDRLMGLRHSSQNSQTNFMWASWLRSYVFVFGAFVLCIGLLAMGLYGQGPERWMSLVMLTVIIFSLFVGGIAWLGSVFSMVRGFG